MDVTTMTPADIAASIIWLLSAVSPTGITTHIGYVDGITAAECESVRQAFDPDITNVSLAYRATDQRCLVRVKQMSQTPQAMERINDDPNQDLSYRD